MKLISDIRLLLLGLWIGSACFFIGVAQSAFAVLPTHELAGSVVNRTLAILNLGGIVIAVILLLLTFVTARNTNIFLLWSERLLMLAVAAGCVVSQFVIGWWLLTLRTQMGRPVDEVAADDPLKIQFNNLHEYSVWILIGAMTAATLAFFVISNRRFGAAQQKLAADLDFKNQLKI